MSSRRACSRQTQNVRGSNYVQIGVFADRIKNRAIVISVLDNLVKGSAGQAIQNMNLMLGFPETTGLEQIALFREGLTSSWFRDARTGQRKRAAERARSSP